MAIAQFKLRNEGTFLGLFWYLLGPLLTFLLLLGIFQDRLGQGIPHYPLYLLLGIIMFNFFQKATAQAVKLFREKNDLIKAIRFPREAIVGATVINAFFSHLLEIVVLAAFILFFGIPVQTLAFYPLVLLFLLAFTFGSGLILSSLGMYIFDLDNLWPFIARVIWFLTPIFYEIGGQKTLFTFNLFNPMFYFITVARDLVIYARVPEAWLLGGMGCYSLLFLLVGMVVFGLLKPRFAELV